MRPERTPENTCPSPHHPAERGRPAAAAFIRAPHASPRVPWIVSFTFSSRPHYTSQLSQQAQRWSYLPRVTLPGMLTGFKPSHLSEVLAGLGGALCHSSWAFCDGAVIFSIRREEGDIQRHLTPKPRIVSLQNCEYSFIIGHVKILKSASSMCIQPR